MTSYETIRVRVPQFAPQFSSSIPHNKLRPPDKCHLDELVVRIHHMAH